MQLNQPQDGYEGPQRRRTEFESEAEKLAYDARNLVKLARAKYSRENVTVRDALDLASRENDDIGALQKAIAIEIKGKPEVMSLTAAEAVSEDPRLQAYQAQYDRWGEGVQSRCSWAELTSRLLANNSHYLHLAEAMNENGVLFGVDGEGNPLFADGGEEPIMTNMNYPDTRKAVYFKQEQGQKPIETGYEMFPYSGEYEKSPEIEMFEASTGKPFVKSPKGNEWRSSWLESGENPSSPRDARFGPYGGFVCVLVVFPLHYSPSRGVRRLLRVKKS